MRNIFKKRIPTLFGILVIVIGIGVTSFLTQQGVILTGQASPSNEPKNVQITNISDTSFTVSYTTADAVFGSLNVGTNTSLGNTVLDERDKTLTEHRVHMITVKNLSPQTSYLFSITSEEDTFLNNGVLYSTKTGPATSSLSSERRNISGKVVNPDGTSPQEALVYLNIPKAQTFVALTKADGSYSFSLNLLRTADLSSYYTVPSGTTVKLSVFGDSLSSQASLSSDEMENVPTITLSQNYDFTLSSSPISGTIPNATSSAQLPTSTPSAPITNAPQILTPKKDQAFSDDQPLFQGTAQPNQEVEITIQSEVVTATVVADRNGNWSYRPDSTLAPGTHTITIKTKDAFGIIKTITQQFTVYAAGSQVGESATPSATLTPTPTPTATPTLTISPTVTATPTAILTPIETATPTPTAILPPAGISTLPTIGIVTAVLMIVGSLLFISTRLRI